MEDEPVPQVTTNRVNSQHQETNNQPRQTTQGLFSAPEQQTNSSSVGVAHKQMADCSQEKACPKLHWCKPCQQAFSDVEIRPHLLAHYKGKLNYCALCIKGFPTERLVEEHLLKHMGLTISKLHAKDVKMKHFDERFDANMQGQIDGVLMHKAAAISRPETRHKADIMPSSTSNTSDDISHPKLQSSTKKVVLSTPQCRVCVVCGERFESWKDVESHLKVHDEETPYRCGKCEKYFKTQDDLTEHETKLCIKLLYPFKCLLCERQFKTKKGEGRHQCVHHKVPNDVNFNVRMRDEGYKATASMTMQMHEGGIEQSSPSAITDIISCPNLPSDMKNTISNPPQCQLCGEGFESWEEIPSHLLLHNEETPYRCGKCEKYFRTQDELTEHESKLCIRLTYPFKCFLCEKVFKSKENLQSHQHVHRKVPNTVALTCDKCGRVGKRLIGEKMMMYKNTALWHYTCSQCENAGSSSSTLSEHVGIDSEIKTLKHKNVPSYMCEKCGKRCHTRQNLRFHQAVHSEERPYRCSICGKTSKCENSANGHLRTHSTQRDHKCTVCGLDFKTKSILKTHIKTHSSVRDHKCNTCGKMFATRMALDRHMFTHTQQRPHKCEVCGNCFKQKGHLRTHMMGHTGEWSHKCSLCGKGYGNPGHLSKHMETKHKSS